MITVTIFISFWFVLKWIKNIQLLPLSNIIVVGKYQYTNYSDIYKSISELGSMGNFFNQDVKAIQNQIKLLPWIKKVSVRKIWPDKLKINFIEYVPVAYWNDFYMLDIDGNSFKIPNKLIIKDNLPKIYGPEINKKEIINNFIKLKIFLEKKNFILKLY